MQIVQSHFEGIKTQLLDLGIKIKSEDCSIKEEPGGFVLMMFNIGVLDIETRVMLSKNKKTLTASFPYRMYVRPPWCSDGPRLPIASHNCLKTAAGILKSSIDNRSNLAASLLADMKDSMNFDLH
jgi:hypothetical protein